jgi:hypothetical protein
MALKSERRRQTKVERFFDAIARRGRAFFAWVWSRQRWFAPIGWLLFICALAPTGVAAFILVRGLAELPFLNTVALMAVIVTGVYGSFLFISRVIYRSQYRGKYNPKLAPYVVRRVSELDKRDYVPEYASPIDRDHPTARLVRHALRTAQRSSLARARVISVAPLPVGICIFGEPLHEKTSLAWEAMRQMLPGWTFVKWPHAMDTSHDIVNNCGKRVVLWLDDLHEYGNRLEAVMLDDLIDQFAEARIQVVVVATCRWHEEEREARAHLGYLLDHLLPIRLASTPGDRTSDPLVLQATVDQPTTPTPTPAQDTLKALIAKRQDDFSKLDNSEPDGRGAQAILHAMKLLWSAGVLVYTQDRIRALAPIFGLGRRNEDLERALKLLEARTFIRPMPELIKRRWLRRNVTKLANKIRGFTPVINADVQPVTAWYLDRVVTIPETPGDALGEILKALNPPVPPRDTSALTLLGDAFLDPRRPYLRNNGQQAIRCYEAALTDIKRDTHPTLWAAAQIGLGNAYMNQVGRTAAAARTGYVTKALTAYQEVVEYRDPGRKTELQNALLAEAWQGVGNAHRANAEDQKGTPEPTQVAYDALVASGMAYIESIERYKRAHSPMQWGMVFYELANVANELSMLDIPSNPVIERLSLLRFADACYRLAREVYTRTTAPTDWAKIQGDLGISLLNLGQRLSDTDAEEKLRVLREAVDALRASMTTFRLFRMYETWAAISVCLGIALRLEAASTSKGGKQEGLNQAEEVLSSTLQYYRPERAPYEWSDVQIELARIKRQQADSEIQAQGATALNARAKTHVAEAKRLVDEVFETVYNRTDDDLSGDTKIRAEMKKRRSEAATLQAELNELAKSLQLQF